MSIEPLPRPLISIVTPIYNAAQFLPATLDSIIAQTETRWECILIDDGSKDESFAVAQDYAAREARFQAHRQDNSGPSVARNLGYSLIHPQSQYITFMDSDDLWTKTALADLLNVLEQAPEMVAVSGLAEFIDGHGNVFAPGFRPAAMRRRMTATAQGLRPLDINEPTGFASFCTGSDQFPPGVILGRRAIYDKAGGFDVRVRGCEDYDLLARISRRGDVAFLNKIVLFYRRHSTNYGANSFVPKEMWRVRCQIYHSLENTLEQRQIVRWAWKFSHRQAACDLCGAAWSQLKARQIKKAAITFARAFVNGLRSCRRAPLPENASESGPVATH
jgi:glycosyltransferase involved in cell wall biosynthesis